MKQALRLSFPGTTYAGHSSKGLGWRSFLQEPVSEPGVALDHYGGTASGQGVAMGKQSRCYNPEGQRARGPEGQRARGPEGQAGGVMSWVLSLARSGGTAGSQDGHETRRHRVRGPFPMGACLLLAGTLALAGCGSSSNSTVAITQQPTQQPSNQPPPQTGGGSGEGEGDGSGGSGSGDQGAGGQGAGGGTPPPTGTTTTEDGDGDTDSGDTTSTDDGGQISTQQPQQPPEPEPQTSGGGNNSNMRQSEPNNPPPNNNPPVVSSLSRSGGRPEPRMIENCGQITPFLESYHCAGAQTDEGVIIDTSISYTVSNKWFSDDRFTSLEGKDRNLEANIIEKNNAFNPLHQSYNFRYNNNIGIRNLMEVTYRKENGFYGIFSYKQPSGPRQTTGIVGDVALKARFGSDKNGKLKIADIEGYIGDNNYDDIKLGPANYGRIEFYAHISEDGQFTSNSVGFSNEEIVTGTGFNELRGSFKNDGSSTSFPTQVVGELEMKRFFDGRPIRNNDYYEYNKNLFSRGDNALAGVFLADKTSEQEIRLIPIERKEEGNIGMFSYGLWASERLEDNRASLSIPKGQEILFPLPDPETINGQQVIDSINVQYKKENGFRGAYVYKDQAGTFESDVHLVVSYEGFPGSGRNNIKIGGFIAKPFTMEGDSFNGIIIKEQSININDGSNGYLNKFSGGLAFGSENFDSTSKSFNGFSKQSLQEQGNFSLTFGATAGQEGSASLEKYPNHVGGELKITGFSLDETENHLDNSLVGVFVGDKESASNDRTNEDIE